MAVNVGMFGNPPGATQQLKTNTRLTGGKRPQAPYSIVVQPALNSLFVTFEDPNPGTGAQLYTYVYRDDESHLFMQLPPGVHSFAFPAQGGSNPPTVAGYLSFVTPSGRESRKVQFVGKAAVQAIGSNPPANPSAPSGSTQLPSGPYGSTGGSGGFRRPSGY
jgi:hypothetical protein